jgi:hypothetical protein
MIYKSAQSPGPHSFRRRTLQNFVCQGVACLVLTIFVVRLVVTFALFNFSVVGI